MYLQEKSQQVNINNLQGLENPHNLIPIDIRYYQIGSLRCFFKNFLKGIFKKKTKNFQDRTGLCSYQSHFK